MRRSGCFDTGSHAGHEIVGAHIGDHHRLAAADDLMDLGIVVHADNKGVELLVPLHHHKGDLVAGLPQDHRDALDPEEHAHLDDADV